MDSKRKERSYGGHDVTKSSGKGLLKFPTTDRDAYMLQSQQSEEAGKRIWYNSDEIKDQGIKTTEVNDLE
jgi:hypothetical protein